MIDLHWVLKHIALNTFNATYKGRFSIQYLNAVSHFSTLDYWCEKNINPTRLGYLKKLWHFSTEVEASGLSRQIHNQYL